MSKSNFDKSAGSMGAMRPSAKDANAIKDKLMSTIAHDDPDCITGTNELKPYVGGSGKPAGPLGLKGKEF